MNPSIDRLPESRTLLDIVERASLVELLQQALHRQPRKENLPARLYADVGVPPSQWPDFTPHIR